MVIDITILLASISLLAFTIYLVKTDKQYKTRERVVYPDIRTKP